MVEIHLEESDRLDWALKAFKRKIAKAGILKDLRKKRYYVKPSEARQLKAAAAGHFCPGLIRLSATSRVAVRHQVLTSCLGLISVLT